MHNRPIDRLCRFGFLLSVLLVLYGTLFPFQFTSTLHEFSMTPYWSVERGRIPSLPDMVSNVALTVPLGFFGFLWFDRGKKAPAVIKWLILGLALGFLAEIIQQAVPSRTSDITDALNNGLGALFGAIAALMVGEYLLDLLSGSLTDRDRTNFVILLGIAAAGALLPFDFGMDVGHIGSSLKQLWRNPWESGTPVSDEWIQMAVFAILGAVAATMRPRLTRFAVLAAFILEPMQLLIESHSPSLRDLVMNLAGVLGGICVARMAPGLVRPATGFALMSAALLAQGLSPYQFGGQRQFEWIPLVEYYRVTTSSALYDAMAGILNYGLLAALWPRKAAILWCVALAGAIEFAQTFLLTRSPGITDVVIALLGGWVGYTVRKAATETRKHGNTE